MSTALKDTFQNFTRTAAPYLYIQAAAHYEEALALVEELMSTAGDDPHHPDNLTISMLATAIANYEARHPGLDRFEKAATNETTDVAMLRLLMTQHGLGVADLPEIGDKSLVSRILSGSRNLTKQHIQKLAARFNINPGMFF